MYIITYKLQTGTLVHRARSAGDALETMRLLRDGGGMIAKIADRSGVELEIHDMETLAQLETGADPYQHGGWPGLLVPLRRFFERLGLWPREPA